MPEQTTTKVEIGTILKGMVDGQAHDLMVRTKAGQVFLDSEETVSVEAKLAELVAAVNLRAKIADVTTQLDTAISNLRTELMGEGIPEAYDTFKELADYIAAHKDVADALQAATTKNETAIADLKAVVDAFGALASKDKVSETELDDALKTKISNAADGNHSHPNKDVLDGISADNVANWNKGAILTAKVYEKDEIPEGATNGSIWLAKSE